MNILTEVNPENIAKNSQFKLLTNSYLQILDVNFVADFIFNKMREKKIYII